MLASGIVKHIIKEYNEGEQIDVVPLNKRLYGKKVFDDHIDDNIKPVWGKYNDRTPLLCNHGISGSGKTVQQALNMNWFTERFKNGVAIEITYNDDVTALGDLMDPQNIKGIPLFQVSLVQGIMLRLIEFCYGYNYSHIFNSSKNNIARQNPQVYGEMIKYHKYEWFTLLFNVGNTLKFVREVLNLPDNAPILLAVDELINLKKTKNPEDMSELIAYLRHICVLIDNSYQNDVENKEPQRTFWLSVSTYGCLLLTEFITFSRREINLQPLSPIFPITHNQENFDILPPILQCFKKENRKKIKFTKENMKLLKKLSILMMRSGGHPRRVSTLLYTLYLIKFEIDYLMYDKYQENYATSKLNELNQHKLEDRMNGEFEFGASNIKSFVYRFFEISKTEEEEISKEMVFRNMVQPFMFTSLTGEEGDRTRDFMTKGYASFVPLLETNLGFLFIPYPFLEITRLYFPFFNSMIVYFTGAKSGVQKKSEEEDEDENRGKNLKTCVCDALNFYVKYRFDLKLQDICCSNGGDEVFEWELEKIPDIPETTLIDYCPSVSRNHSLHCIDFGHLAGLSPGFYIPKEKYNNTADVIGILNVKFNQTKVKRLILFIQLKDWFKDTVSEKVDGGETREKNIVDEWRWSQQFATESDVYLTRDDEEKSVNQFSGYWKEHKDHRPVFLIFSANKIKSISTEGKFSNVNFSRTTQYKEEYLRKNEGTMNLEHSKSWFPTFGYNMQAFTKPNELDFIFN